MGYRERERERERERKREREREGGGGGGGGRVVMVYRQRDLPNMYLVSKNLSCMTCTTQTNYQCVYIVIS